jgi:hypothetical protein
VTKVILISEKRKRIAGKYFRNVTLKLCFLFLEIKTFYFWKKVLPQENNNFFIISVNLENLFLVSHENCQSFIFTSVFFSLETKMFFLATE